MTEAQQIYGQAEKLWVEFRDSRDPIKGMRARAMYQQAIALRIREKAFAAMPPPAAPSNKKPPLSE